MFRMSYMDKLLRRIIDRDHVLFSFFFVKSEMQIDSAMKEHIRLTIQKYSKIRILMSREHMINEVLVLFRIVVWYYFMKSDIAPCTYSHWNRWGSWIISIQIYLCQLFFDRYNFDYKNVIWYSIKYTWLLLVNCRKWECQLHEMWLETSLKISDHDTLNKEK